MWMVMFFIFYFFWCFANIESKQWISHQAIRFPIKWNFTRHLQRELMHLYDMGMTNDRYFIGISIASQFQSLLLQPKLSITRDTVDAVLCPPPPKKKKTSYHPVCWKREGARHLDSLSCAMAQNWKSLGGNECSWKSFGIDGIWFGRSKHWQRHCQGFLALNPE